MFLRYPELGVITLGKMLIVIFQEDETEVLNTILSVLNAGRAKYEIHENQIKTVIKYGDLYIDSIHRIVCKRQKEIQLTCTEFEIIYLLAQNPGVVFSKEQIYDIVWNEPYFGDYNIVMKHIKNIREKIEDDPHNPYYIQTVWGVGYRFNKNISSSL